ncbi:MAG: zinc ribbon domain-containing protein [Ruminococcaceae bacterium]|nr:zinc ribbon domain-containing protein [Oscillospiraceae bacterium]
MTAVIVMILLFLLIFGLGVTTTVLTAVWVYKDAKKRNMDAIMWTLLAVLIPSYIGLIIYLVSRQKEKLYVCPRCGGDVKTDYAVCPTCTLPLRRQCPQCGLACEETWHNCPRCSAVLEPMMYPMAKPQEKKDHLVRNIVLLIVANIVAVIALYASIFAFAFNNPEVFYEDEFNMPYTEEYDEFDIYPGSFDFDVK